MLALCVCNDACYVMFRMVWAGVEGEPGLAGAETLENAWFETHLVGPESCIVEAGLYVCIACISCVYVLSCHVMFCHVTARHVMSPHNKPFNAM